ncbi:MAG: hypothetical protein V6Z81_07105 [Parvularculales bacterium]
MNEHRTVIKTVPALLFALFAGLVPGMTPGAAASEPQSQEQAGVEARNVFNAVRLTERQLTYCRGQEVIFLSSDCHKRYGRSHPGHSRERILSFCQGFGYSTGSYQPGGCQDKDNNGWIETRHEWDWVVATDSPWSAKINLRTGQYEVMAAGELLAPAGLVRDQLIAMGIPQDHLPPPVAQGLWVSGSVGRSATLDDIEDEVNLAVPECPGGTTGIWPDCVTVPPPILPKFETPEFVAPAVEAVSDTVDGIVEDAGGLVDDAGGLVEEAIKAIEEGIEEGAENLGR